jgi:hypothetical protein
MSIRRPGLALALAFGPEAITMPVVRVAVPAPIVPPVPVAIPVAVAVPSVATAPELLGDAHVTLVHREFGYGAWGRRLAVDARE